MVINFDEEKRDLKVEQLLQKEEEELAQTLSSKYGMPYADLSRISIDTNGLKLIPEEEARVANIAIVDMIGKKLKVAMVSPNRDETQAILRKLEERGYLIESFLVSHSSIEKALERYKDLSFASATKAGTLEISSEEIQKIMAGIKNIADVKKIVEEITSMKKTFRISKIVEAVLAGAIATGSSDVHVEPGEENTLLRFRLDGVLADVTTFDNETYNLLLSRIKILSGMKINIRGSAQDGRYSIIIGTDEIEVRSSILPGNYGESIVMRLLNPASIQVPIEDLGVSPKLMEIFLREVEKPNGMILNTGPTGSGKTTTLYSFLRHRMTTEVKIITIEDPIEYHLKGIVQTQVDNKRGYDFAKGLKSSLRQDPDIMMVGEIRDLETAETAVHASLTGHLVFSTLHTNNAAGTFPRLIDLGVNPKILTSAINMAIAQRLVRILCVHCKKETKLVGKDLELVKSIYEEIKDPEVPFTDVTYEPQGCEKCSVSGYKGRIGIFEAVIADEKIEAIIDRNPSESEIKKIAFEQGIMDMAQDGVIKILKGITTLSEVGRVVDLHNRTGLGDEHEYYNKLGTVTTPEDEKDILDIKEFIK